jgi:hypothetical protein
MRTLWPYIDAVQAVNALADAGRVLLEGDVRPQGSPDAVNEIPISDYGPSGDDDAERGRQSALAAILRAETISGLARPYVLLTWRSPNALSCRRSSATLK